MQSKLQILSGFRFTPIEIPPELLGGTIKPLVDNDKLPRMVDTLAATLALLEFVAAELHALRCLVVVTCRPMRRLVLLHHDGGEEEGVNVLERLIGRADAVFCPIDCVSHQACLLAKQLCRRLEKPFVPLRTGSGTCFLRAIDRWRGAEIADPAREVRA